MKQKHQYTKAQRSRGGRNKPRREERLEEVIARAEFDRMGSIVTEGVEYTSEGAALGLICAEWLDVEFTIT